MQKIVFSLPWRNAEVAFRFGPGVHIINHKQLLSKSSVTAPKAKMVPDLNLAAIFLEVASQMSVHHSSNSLCWMFSLRPLDASERYSRTHWRSIDSLTLGDLNCGALAFECSIMTMHTHTQHVEYVHIFNAIVTSHHPGSLDLAPCDFLLNSKMKFKLRGRPFDTVRRSKVHQRRCMIRLKSRTSRKRPKRGRSTGSGVSLCKVNLERREFWWIFCFL